MADPAVPSRANPSADAYERARKVVFAWLGSLPLIDSMAWEIDASSGG